MTFLRRPAEPSPDLLSNSAANFLHNEYKIHRSLSEKLDIGFYVHTETSRTKVALVPEVKFINVNKSVIGAKISIECLPTDNMVKR